MDLKKELVQVDEQDIGLDRANITSDNQIQLPALDDSSSSSTDTNSSPPPSRSSSHLVNSLRDRKHHAAVKIRKTLHISKPTDDIDSASPILANTAEETSDSRLEHKLPVPDKHSVKEILHHPMDAVKSKVGDQGNHEVAANIAAKEIPHGDEVDLINAHDKVGSARTEQERVEATDEIKRLMRDRQSKFARWSLDRHVTKIRVLPREGMRRRERGEFEKRDADGRIVVDWRGYASHASVIPHRTHSIPTDTHSSWYSTPTSTEANTSATAPTPQPPPRKPSCPTSSASSSPPRRSRNSS